jgi:hypothetical protein
MAQRLTTREFGRHGEAPIDQRSAVSDPVSAVSGQFSDQRSTASGQLSDQRLTVNG